MILYNVVKYLSRIGLKAYFGRLEINGAHYIPRDTPYIIAPNHQNAFLDAVIVASLQSKPVHFLTRSDVFIAPFKGVLAALNMMPVYRLRDGYDLLKKNDETFATCNELLRQGKPVLIFPEGNMDEGHALRPLTKGTARMAFQAQEQAKDLVILPVGINYFHHEYPRHKLILNYGPPLKMADYLSVYEDSNAKGLIQLRNDLTSAMHDLLLIPDKDELYDQRLKIHSREYEALDFKALKKELTEPQSLRSETYYPSLRWITHFLKLPNLGPHLLIQYILSGVKDPQFKGSLKYIIGLLVFPLWWLIIGGILLFFLSPAMTAAVVIVAIISLFGRATVLNYVR